MFIGYHDNAIISMLIIVEIKHFTYICNCSLAATFNRLVLGNSWKKFTCNNVKYLTIKSEDVPVKIKHC